MPQKIMDVLMLGRCSHEFSWPRRGADGDYYQVCMLCAAEYQYDWTTMRRTRRVEHAKPETIVRRNHAREKRPSWTPRARRLKLDVALRYRVNNTSTWFEGTIDNLSQSGLLFRGPQQLPVNALIEMEAAKRPVPASASSTCVSLPCLFLDRITRPWQSTLRFF